MPAFFMQIPTRVHFGRNIFRSALKQEENILGSKVLVVTTGRSLKRLGYVQQLSELLHEISKQVFVFDGISANPELSEVKRAVEEGKAFGAESIIGFGGGSAMDAAKAVAVGMVCEEPLDTYYFDGEQPDSSLPVIAIPTTAGTGSELSRGAIISDKASGMKKGIRGECLYPKVAIVDSHFTEQIPYQITMETGFDVFAHAFESYISVKANRFSEMLSLEAVRLASDNLIKLVADLNDVVARENMSYASMLMGINLGNVGTALPHRLQYPIGAATGTGHGAGLLALYPAWLKMEYDFSKDKIDRIASIIEKKECSGKLESIDVILKFIEKLSVRRNLGAFGIENEDVVSLSKKVTGVLENDPASQIKDVVLKIYEDAIYD